MMLTIIKLGGSYAHAPELCKLAASANGTGHTVLVPGGGPFAATVRHEQQRIGFNDAAAHCMALLAMAQFGLALAGLSPGLTPCVTFDEIRAVLAGGGVPVWLPLGLPGREAGVEESWAMTSDSMAAWLAGQLDAERLIFVKQVDPPPPVTLSDLVAEGVVDPLVPAYLARSRAQAWLCGPGDLAGLGEALARDEGWGQPIT